MRKKKYILRSPDNVKPEKKTIEYILNNANKTIKNYKKRQDKIIIDTLCGN